MILLTVQGQTYNLDYLVKYVFHTGESEVTPPGPADDEPSFKTYRYIELLFADGTNIALDKIQTEAFLTYIARRSLTLDLDRIDELAVGHVVVHGTDEGGDIIFQTPEEAADATRPITLDLDPPQRPGPALG